MSGGVVHSRLLSWAAGRVLWPTGVAGGCTPSAPESPPHTHTAAGGAGRISCTESALQAGTLAGGTPCSLRGTAAGACVGGRVGALLGLLRFQALTIMLLETPVEMADPAPSCTQYDVNSSQSTESEPSTSMRLKSSMRSCTATTVERELVGEPQYARWRFTHSRLPPCP